MKASNVGPLRADTYERTDVTAESVCCVYEERDRLRGLRMTFLPHCLRFFQARFEPLGGRLKQARVSGWPFPTARSACRRRL